MQAADAIARSDIFVAHRWTGRHDGLRLPWDCG
jgi:hypothetical protein